MISATVSGESSLPATNDDKSERMLASNIDLVRRIAGRIHQRVPPCVELDDLFQAGIVGLIDAIRKFDERRHVRFEHYAQFRINGAIIDSLRELDWSPRALRRKLTAFETNLARHLAVHRTIVNSLPKLEWSCINLIN